MPALPEVADRQAVWSSTANLRKRNYDLARNATFAFSIIAALLATIAGQSDGQLRLYLSVASAVLLGLVSFITARFLTSNRVAAWTRARAASEALKREAYKFAAGAAPYDDAATRENQLNDEREKIEEGVEDLLGIVAEAEGKGSAPREPISRADYIEKRVRGQALGFFEPKAKTYAEAAGRLRIAELGLSMIAAVLAAVVGVAGNTLFGLKFDFVAFTAVLTTIAGAILAHIESARYDFLVVSYRAAALRLRNALARAGDLSAAAPQDWSAFVNHCEEIISSENNSWVAKHSAPPQ